MMRLSFAQLMQRRFALPQIRAWLILTLVLLWGGGVLVNYYAGGARQLVDGRFAFPRLYGDRSLPYFGEAVVRAGSGVLGASFLLISAMFVGIGIAHAFQWRFTGRSEQLPVVAALGIGTFAYHGLALASLGLYRSEALRVCAVVPVVVGIGWWFIRSSRPIQPQLLQPKLHLPPDWIWLVCTLLAVGCAFIAALAPESSFDALWYHLAYPQRYLQHGRLVDVPTDYVSLYPMTWELWFGYGLAIGGQPAATLLHFACMPLLALLVYELSTRFTSNPHPFLATALFATIPTVMWEASTAYIDLALALHVTVAIYAVLRFLDAEEPQWLVIGALNLGLALATKHLALIVWGLICSLLVIELWFKHRSIWLSLRPALILGALALLFPLPWYARSWWATGNPVFPELYHLFGAPAHRWDEVTNQGLGRFLDHFGRSRTLWNLITLPWHLTIHAASYDGTLGPVFLIVLPLVAFKRLQRELRWMLIFVVCFVAFWASPLSSFQMRFLVPVMPILAVLAAVAVRWFGELLWLYGGRRAQTLGASVLLVLLVLNLPLFTSLHERDHARNTDWLNSTLHGLPLGVVIGAEGSEQYLTRTVTSYGVWNYANATVPDDAYILTWSGGEEFYTRHQRVWANATSIRALAWATSEHQDQALETLYDSGITHLIIDRRPRSAADEWGLFALTHPAVRRQWYDLLYEDAHFGLYRVRREALRAKFDGGLP